MHCERRRMHTQNSERKTWSGGGEGLEMEGEGYAPKRVYNTSFPVSMRQSKLTRWVKGNTTRRYRPGLCVLLRGNISDEEYEVLTTTTSLA